MSRILRLLPPPQPISSSLTVKGRSYSAAPGAFLDVNESDAEVLLANGWIAGTPLGTLGGGRIAHGGIGVTAARPSRPKKGMHFYDTTVEADIVFDGATWRNSITAAGV